MEFGYNFKLGSYKNTKKEEFIVIIGIQITILIYKDYKRYKVSWFYKFLRDPNPILMLQASEFARANYLSSSELFFVSEHSLSCRVIRLSSETTKRNIISSYKKEQISYQKPKELCFLTHHEGCVKESGL